MDRSVLLILLAIGGVFVVGALDWVTGVELRVYPLYYLPISMGAWHGRRRAAVLLALVSTAVWGLGNLFAGLEFSTPLIWSLNVLMYAIGFNAVGFLIAELRKRLDSERALSRVDTRTGLANPRALHERTEFVFEWARKHERPVALAYVDLDNFKLVNDSHGHAEGDAVLEVVAIQLRAAVRGSDIVARIGGDEFALVLPDISRAEAEKVLDRFRVRLMEAMRERGWPVTASIGAVILDRPPKHPAEAFGRVDALMYRAKRAGKDRVVFEDDAPA